MTSHEQEVRELYEKYSVEIPGITAGRAISFEGFKLAIDMMMDKAYNYGKAEGLHAAEDIVDQAFSKGQWI